MSKWWLNSKGHRFNLIGALLACFDMLRRLSNTKCVYCMHYLQLNKAFIGSFTCYETTRLLIIIILLYRQRKRVNSYYWMKLGIEWWIYQGCIIRCFLPFTLEKKTPNHYYCVVILSTSKNEIKSINHAYFILGINYNHLKGSFPNPIWQPGMERFNLSLHGRQLATNGEEEDTAHAPTNYRKKLP